MSKLTEASKAKKNDSKISTMTMPKTMPVQNLLRYISFKSVNARTQTGSHEHLEHVHLCAEIGRFSMKSISKVGFLENFKALMTNKITKRM